MCTYSVNLDYGRKIWDVPPSYPHIYPHPNVYPTPVPTIYPVPQPKRMPTRKEWDAFLKLLDQAEEFDEEAGQPDCEDPEKVAWKQRIQDKLDALQAELDDEPGATDPATPEWEFTEGISNQVLSPSVIRSINGITTTDPSGLQYTPTHADTCSGGITGGMDIDNNLLA